jgi:recombinational DNA repair protein (RecF pathway)
MFLDIKRICGICGTNETHIDKHGYQHWHNYEGKRYCHKCYGRLIDAPNRNRELATRQFLFLKKQLHDPKKIRTGICSECHRNIGDSYVGHRNKVVTVNQTQLHHEFYLTICPWFSRRELCVACHSKIRWHQWRERQKSIPKPLYHCSLCKHMDSVSKYWYFHKDNRLCRRCWRNTVYEPVARERKKSYQKNPRQRRL